MKILSLQGLGLNYDVTPAVTQPENEPDSRLFTLVSYKWFL